jgi:hypothetical protein
MKNILRITILFGLAAGAAGLAFAGGQPQAKNPDSKGVQEAIRFERAKDAADARQARLETKQPGTAEHSIVVASRHWTVVNK